MVAKSYEKDEIISDPFEKNNRMYVKIKHLCDRCCGTGFYGPVSVDGGRCFECGGRRYVTQTVRWYTEKERAAMDRAAEARNAEKEAAAAARLQEKIDNRPVLMQAWYEKNGFNSDGITYVAIGNTYEIKDSLKEAGFKYSSSLGWHGADPRSFNTITFSFDDLYEWVDEWGRARERSEDTAAIVREKVKSAEISISCGEFVGEEKERLKNLILTCISTKLIEGFYSSILYVFTDKEGHNFQWFSSSVKELHIGETYTVNGTVKNHSSYKGINYTVLTRCTIK